MRAAELQLAACECEVRAMFGLASEKDFFNSPISGHSYGVPIHEDTNE